MKEGKKIKYQELAADLATQYLGWKVTISPLVMGDLGTVTELLKELLMMNIFTQQQIKSCA